ncbi:winged helix-turn-helix domain-containing protein [Erwinia typographi]|uniref:winged helix-turn-helix domain-containing protein n=1 Tax=Erwinia typographi TaxID=371042 RepID=UPI0018DEBCC1|nr:helix-turn-helix domain-containing protein [Erwinia typographi]
MQSTDKDNFFENDMLSLSLEKRVLFLKKTETIITLTVLQSRLIFFLLSDVTRKSELIEKVWPDKHIAITDNNYHQLIYQCRALFTNHGLPSDVIRTVHRHGLMFDLSRLEEHYSLKNSLSNNAGEVNLLKLTKNKLIFMCSGGIILQFLVFIFSVTE